MKNREQTQGLRETKVQFKHDDLMLFAINICKPVLYCDVVYSLPSPAEETALCWEVRCSSHRMFDRAAGLAT